MSIPYHATRKYSIRPNRFRLAPDHVLNDGCRLMSGGNLAGSEKYFDSSVERNDGGIISFAAGGGWDAQLGRQTIHKTDLAGWISTGLVIGSEPAVSYSFWLRRYDSFANRYVVDTSNGSIGLIMRTTSTGFLDVYWFTDGGLANAVITAGHDTGWRHITVVYSNGVLSTYADGLPRATSSAGSGNTIASAYPVYITSAWNGGGSCHCDTGDVCFWNRALSLPEIQTLALLDPMLDGWVQPAETTTYFIPLGTTPPVEEPVTDIFTSLIIGA